MRPPAALLGLILWRCSIGGCVASVTLEPHIYNISDTPCSGKHDAAFPPHASLIAIRTHAGGGGVACPSAHVTDHSRRTADNGRQDPSQIEAAQPACDRRPRTGAASLVLLCHGSDHRADPSAFHRRRELLE